MNHWAKISLCSCLLLLAACNTTHTFQHNMTAMTGKSSAELVQNLGAPDQRIEEDGQTILVFRPVRINIPIPTPSLGSGLDSGYIPPRVSSSYNIHAHCQVFFILQSDQVTDWYSQGKDCPKH